MDENKHRLFRALTALAVFLTVFVVVLGINELRRSGLIGKSDSLATIVVSGNGEVFAIPDIATFTFTVTEEADTNKAAQDGAAERVNRALELLKDNGVEERDIKTTSYNLYPRYEYREDTIACVTFPCPRPPNKRVLVGYEVSQSLLIKVRDVEEAGEILSLVGDIASNVGGINFTIDEEDELKREAREMAIDEAQKKAKALAKDLDIKLVRIISFSEGGSYPSRFFALESAAIDGIGGEAPNIPVGENKISSNVTITYEIR